MHIFVVVVVLMGPLRGQREPIGIFLKILKTIVMEEQKPWRVDDWLGGVPGLNGLG